MADTDKKEETLVTLLAMALSACESAIGELDHCLQQDEAEENKEKPCPCAYCECEEVLEQAAKILKKGKVSE